MKKSAGLIIFVLWNEEIFAILQKRGEFNPETMKTESFPGSYQVTIHGGCEGNSNFKKTIIDEAKQEMPGFKARACNMVTIERNKTEAMETVTFGTLISQNLQDFLLSINLHSGSGGIKLITKDDVDQIQELTKEDKVDGVIDRRIIKMFPDEIKALRKGFEIFEK